MRRFTLAVSIWMVVSWGLPCTAMADEIVAASGSRDDIQAAVDQAAPGDTVLVPEGTYAFVGTVNVAKPLTIMGTDRDATLLQGSNDGGSLFVVTSSQVTFRGLGLSGNPQGSGAILDSGISFVDSQDFVVVDCAFADFGGSAVSARGEDVRGVVSGSRFVDIYRDEIGNIGYGVLVNGGGGGSWNRPLDLGSDRYVFIEDSTFIGNRHAVASNNGSRYVFRFNHTREQRPDSAQHIDAHGFEYGSTRGSRAFEIYGNQVESNSTTAWAGITIRGGDGVVFENALIGQINLPIYLSNRLDGSSTCDYPNLDQSRDLYVWANTMDGAEVGLSIRAEHSCLFAEERDYFFHAPTGYQPYTYPHPLVDADGDGVSVPADCDDGADQVHPAAPELCDSVDNNCDGVVDEGFSFDTDSQHCGGCGIVCQAQERCVDGRCDPIEPGTEPDGGAAGAGSSASGAADDSGCACTVGERQDRSVWFILLGLVVPCLGLISRRRVAPT